MTTRAEEIAGDGPYTVGLWPDDRPNARKRYTIKGPTPCDSWWHNFEEARSRVDSLNAAYKQGQQDRWIPIAEGTPSGHLRDMGYLRPSQAIGEQTPVAKGEMWHPDPWLIGNVEAWKKEPPTQVGEDDDKRMKQARAELAQVMAANGWDIYGGSDYPWVVAMNYAWQEGWLDAFTRSPMSSEARDKAIEALKAAHREAQESRKHFSSDLDRIHIASLVVQLSQALSALRGE